MRSPAARRLTNVPADKLLVGLVPIAFSANGSRLLSEFEGQDTSAAWTVRVPSGHARPIVFRNQSVVGAGIYVASQMAQRYVSVLRLHVDAAGDTINVRARATGDLDVGTARNVDLDGFGAKTK